MNVTRTSISPGKILVLPPHDVVQGGKPHLAGEDSGRYLQKAIIQEFQRYPQYKAIPYTANKKLNHISDINREDAIEEGKNIGVDYSLILSLGEFLNAAPMTFRADFVSLRSGMVIDMENGTNAWTLNRTFLLQKSNLGSHYSLLDMMARYIVDSIAKE